VQEGIRRNLNEVAGSLGDLATFIPLAVGLITVNGVNPTALFLSAGLLYVVGGLYYRLPIPVQPLKATAAIAIASQAPPEAVSAAAFWIGVLFVVASLFRFGERLGKIFTRPVVRGIQLGLGILLVKGGLKAVFGSPALPLPYPGFPAWLGGAVLAAVAAAIVVLSRGSRRYPAMLVAIPFGALAGCALASSWMPEAFATGWVRPDVGFPSAADPYIVFAVLLLPQLPLTLGNSIVATADTADRYYGSGARRVTPRALAATLGIGNLVAGLLGGMPMCHGSGGVTAHYRFGARTGRANLFIGGVFVLIALLFGRSIADLCRILPAPILGAFLLYVGVQHAGLVRDVLDVRREWAVALCIGLMTLVTGNLAAAFAAGFVLDRATCGLFPGLAGRKVERAPSV
jgi:SulP family sulfate permease